MSDGWGSFADLTQTAKLQAAKATASKAPTIDRFYLKTGESRKIIFLTEGTRFFECTEHNPAVGMGARRFQNWVTCLQVIGKECPLCEHSRRTREAGPYKVYLATVLDVDGYVTKTGEQRKYVKKIFAMKNADRLNRKYMKLVDQGRGLRGALFTVARSADPKSPNCGDDFDYESHVDLRELIAAKTIPDALEYDFRQVCAPNPARVLALADMLNGVVAPGEGPVDIPPALDLGESSTPAADPAEVPF